LHPQRESYESNTLPRGHLHLQRHMSVNNLPRVVTRQCAGRELNLQPLDYKSNTLPLHYRATRVGVCVAVAVCLCIYMCVCVCVCVCQCSSAVVLVTVIESAKHSAPVLPKHSSCGPALTPEDLSAVKNEWMFLVVCQADEFVSQWWVTVSASTCQAWS